jgi:8-oxo-dGTP pyrophosphatase MutT (NUDIX family)
MRDCLIRSSQLNIEDIQSKLASVNCIELENPFPGEMFTTPFRDAAVLVPLINQDNCWHLLFIRRTQIDGDIHSGQVAFPGGGREAGDKSALDTALREAYEEIGLLPTQVEFLGQMGPMKTISNFVITPVIGYVDWPILLTPSASEVSHIFTIPLDWLADPQNWTFEWRILPAPYPPVQVIYYKPYSNELLWGATARITHRLLQLLDIIE